VILSIILDCALLEAEQVEVVFAPSVAEVYPAEDTRQFAFGTLDKVMEGEHRPGHFNGVAQVVSKLFGMVKPDAAYFGEKDFQQLAIVKEMVKQLSIPVKVVPCPIVREADGLAMSSRNARLTAEHRAVVPIIAQVLKDSQAMAAEKNLLEVKQFVVASINAEPLLEVEYFDVVDALSLQSSKSWNETGEKVGCVAVFAGEIRLIDNVRFIKK
jgi:pantoate--beta-alanine ligase